MSNTHPKLNLSKQDLRLIFNNIQSSTISKLNLHLPTSNDDLKNNVEIALEEFLIDVLEMAKPALMVDGIDVAQEGLKILSILSLKPKEVVEPFDIELNNQLREILLQVEQETVELTRLRRELPLSARKAYNDLVSKTDIEVSEGLADLEREEALEKDKKVHEETEEDVVGDTKKIASEYEQYILTLDGLKGSLPELQGELVRYEKMVKFLEGAYTQQVNEQTGGAN